MRSFLYLIRFRRIAFFVSGADVSCVVGQSLDIDSFTEK